MQTIYRLSQPLTLRRECALLRERALLRSRKMPRKASHIGEVNGDAKVALLSSLGKASVPLG